ncbi:hypothetical protein LOK49_LG12G01035 [Camellia lanceoleosa]|uniref:Uncharacterized protein n=1 Tax=Camellia lanceoleosa TaxID=1840588 RepID=A0ACC0FVN7_9ERIC|nr:hypothetical protein LOK49_LG12G01035 [Camellia lanceoleosa]
MRTHNINDKSSINDAEVDGGHADMYSESLDEELPLKPSSCLLGNPTSSSLGPEDSKAQKVVEKLQLLKKNLGEEDFNALKELRKIVLELSALSQLGTKNSTKISMKNNFAAPKTAPKLAMQQQQLVVTATLSSSPAALLHTATTTPFCSSIKVAVKVVAFELQVENSLDEVTMPDSLNGSRGGT